MLSDDRVNAAKQLLETLKRIATYESLNNIITNFG